VYKRPAADAGPLKEIGQGQSVLLSGTASGTGIQYSWSPPVAMDDASKLQPTVAPVEDQVYYLTVASTFGCGVATDSVRVIVYKGIFIPTAFTPNGDGKNDLWRIFGLTVYPSYEILVFNRYGQVVYRSTNATAGWNGTFNGQPVPIGTYPYLIKVEGGKRVLKGLVNVIR
jgi:gliding motility-associated-like protein